MVLSTIKERDRSIFYLLSNARYAKKCCFPATVEGRRERCDALGFLAEKKFPRTRQTTKLLSWFVSRNMDTYGTEPMDARYGKERWEVSLKSERFVKYTPRESKWSDGFDATLSSTITVLWIILRIKAEYTVLAKIKESEFEKLESGLSSRNGVKSTLNIYVYEVARISLKWI